MVSLPKPQFTAEATNEKKDQQDVYKLFLDYLNVLESKILTEFSPESDYFQTI